MSEEDVQNQLRILNKQLSTMIEILGTEFILRRQERGRVLEKKYGRNNSKYTNKLKNIDDMNELCELMKLALAEMHKRPQEIARISSDQRFIQKMNNPNYKVKTLDELYPPRPLLIKKVEPPKQSKKQTPTMPKPVVHTE